MSDYDDMSDLKHIRNWFVGFLLIIMLLGGAATIVSRAFDLAWFPWEVKMKTGMIRNSNSYITTQQTALRQLKVDWYGATTDGQKKAIINQMQQIADLIPDNVPPDIRTFIANPGE